MEFKRRRYNHSYLNIAPLVDVVFLLLLFFMLTSRLIEEPAIKVRLPESKTAVNINEAILTVVIDKQGRIYFRNKEVKLKELKTQIESELSGKKKKRVKIKADRSVSISVVIKVIDQIKLAGVRDFGIVTEKLH